MPVMQEGCGHAVARRTLVVGVAAGLTTAVGGCGIRIDQTVRPAASRTASAITTALAALCRDTARLAALADRVAAAPGAALALLHQRQHTVLRTLLLRVGIGAALLDLAPSSSPTPTGSPVATPTVAQALASLAAGEATAARRARDLADTPADLRATVAALHAQRYAAATLLAGKPPAVPGRPLRGAEIAALTEHTQVAIYLIEVAAARSAGTLRNRAERTLAALRATAADHVAGGSRPAAVLGRSLPFPVENSADADRLIRMALTALRSAHGRALPAVLTAQGADGLAATTRWLGDVEVQCHGWGVPLEPFPGLE
jgi:hypothetical protein